MTSARDLGLHADAATAHTAIAPLPDLKVIMADQKAMAAAAGTVIATSNQIANDIATSAGKAQQAAQQVIDDPNSTPEQRAQARQAVSDAKQAQTNWGATGDYARALKVVTGVLVGGVAGQGAGQIAANAGAPYAAGAIGDYFAEPGHENQTAQVLSHAVLGAILAAANGSGAAAGAGAAGELAAKVLSRELYPQAYDADGSFHPERLNASQTNTVIALSTGVGALVAGTAGGALADAAVGGNVAANAATNNWLNPKEIEAKKTVQGLCTGSGGADKQACATLQVLNVVDAAREKQNNATLYKGIEKGLTDLLLSPVTVPVELVNSVIEQGAGKTAVDLVKGVAGLPGSLYDGLSSGDPEKQGKALVDALALGYGVTQVARSVGKVTASTVAETAAKGAAFNSGVNTAARQVTANAYYKTLGWEDARIASHTSGIDFSKPVEVVTLPKGTQVVQYQIPGNPVGGYFAPVGTTAELLGISSVGRQPIIYTTTEDISVLRSTAADTSKNLGLPESARGSGGGIQFFSNNRNVFQPLGQ